MKASKNTWLKLGSIVMKGIALALPYLADKFIDSKLDAEDSEEFVRDIVREELENRKE